MHASSTNSAPRTHALWHAPLVLTVFVALRLLLVPAAEPVLHPDSHVYLSEANQSHHELLAAFVGRPSWRPTGYPIFLKLLGATEPEDLAALRRVVLVQLLITSAAFSVAALAVSRRVCRTRGGRIAVIALFALASLTIFAGPWDGAILSESLSLACLLMIGAALARALDRRPDPANQVEASFAGAPNDDTTAPAYGRLRFAAWYLLLLPLAAFFMQLRDAHVPIAACLIVILAVHTLRCRRRWSGASRAAAVLWLIVGGGLAVAQARAAVVSGRADWPLTNVLSLRVWQSPGGFETFVREHGLPSQLRPLVGYFVWDGWGDQPEYAAWLGDRGRRAYAQFLVTNPGYSWQQAREAFRFAAEDLSSNELAQYFQRPDAPTPLRLHLSSALTDLMTMPQRLINAAGGYRIFWPVSAGLIILAGVVLLRERQAGALAAGAFVVLMLTAQLVSTYFLDACEDSRHNLLAYNALVFIFWLPILILCDDVSARREPAT